MGMFDSVMVRCPICSGKIEFQSKAGACVLAEFDPTEAPEEIVADLDGEREVCRNCGHEIWLEKVTAPTLRVRP